MTDQLTQYSTESTSATSAKVEKILLRQTKRTSRYINPTIVKNDTNPQASLEIELIYERDGNEEGDPPIVPNVSRLKKGESAKYTLDSDATLKLYQELGRLLALGKEPDVFRGKRKHIVIEVSSGTSFSKNDQDALALILSKCQTSPGLAEKLALTQPDLIEDAYKYRLFQKKKEGLTRFEAMLAKENKEKEWEQFFFEHPWILGGGMSEIQILGMITNQPALSGANVLGQGAKKGDFLLHSLGDIRFTSLAEIKTNHTELLKCTPYRTGVYLPSDELSGGLAQLQSYMRNWQIEGSRTEKNKDLLESNNIYTVQPRGILIIGNLAQVKNNREMREGFELYRRSQKDVHIVTFDEVYERAKFLFGN